MKLSLESDILDNPMAATISGLIDKKFESKKQDKSKQKQQDKSKTVNLGGGLDPDSDDEKDFKKDEERKRYEKFKKKDGSGRYECEKGESPQWKETEHYKSEYRTNGKNGNERVYYRWDKGHKDIEMYDSKARYLGSKDPVTGKIYRRGTMEVSESLRKVIK